MSTLTGPNLEPGRVEVEKLMDDTCVIVRNPMAERDGVYNPTTRTVGTSAATIVYDAASVGTGRLGARPLLGRCKVSSLRDSQPRSYEVADVQIDARPYRFSIPVDTPPLAIGDRVYIVSSRRSDLLVGAVFVIREVIVSTFAINQKCVAERQVWTGSGVPDPAEFPDPFAKPLSTSGFDVLTAGEALVPGRVVRLSSDGTVVLFDPSNTAYYGEALGITASTAAPGDRVSVCSRGPLELTGWGLTSGALYFAAAGGLITPTPPTSGMLVPVGVAASEVAVTTDTLAVNIGLGVIL